MRAVGRSLLGAEEMMSKSVQPICVTCDDKEKLHVIFLYHTMSNTLVRGSEARHNENKKNLQTRYKSHNSTRHGRTLPTSKLNE